MPLIFNGNSIPGSGAVIENGVSLSSLKANNVEVWKKQATIIPAHQLPKHRILDGPITSQLLIPAHILRWTHSVAQNVGGDA